MKMIKRGIALILALIITGILSMTASAQAPYTSISVSDYGQTTADLFAYINYNYGDAVSTVQFQYAKSGSSYVSAKTCSVTNQEQREYYCTLTGLTPGTTYNVRTLGTNVYGEKAYSIVKSFTTAKPSPVTLNLSAASLTAATDGGKSSTVSVTCSAAWSISSNVSWINSFSKTSGTGNGTFYFFCDANTSTSGRVGYITVKSGTVSKQISVSQPGKTNTLTVSASSLSSAAEGGTSSTVTVTSNTSWTVKSNVTWINGFNRTGGTGNSTFNFKIAANTATASRTGTVTVTGGGIIRTITVTQTGAANKVTQENTANTLTVSASSLSSAAEGGTSSTVTVTSNTSWTVKSNVTWMNGFSRIEGTGNSTFNFKIVANTVTASRTGTVTVTGGGITRTVTVTQAGKANTEAQTGEANTSASSVPSQPPMAKSGTGDSSSNPKTAANTSTASKPGVDTGKADNILNPISVIQNRIIFSPSITSAAASPKTGTTGTPFYYTVKTNDTVTRIEYYANGNTYFAYQTVCSSQSGTTLTWNSTGLTLPAGTTYVRVKAFNSSGSTVTKDITGFKVFLPPALYTTNAAYELQNTNAGTRTKPQYINAIGNRSADAYKKIIDQFEVETNPRYAKRGGNTYCNIFAWDVTIAMGVEIPHYYDAKSGGNMTNSNGHVSPGYTEMSANGMCVWLSNFGKSNGWNEVSAETAQQKANAGFPSITAWYCPGGIGHVQVVRPYTGAFDAAKGPRVAQSGGTNYNNDFASKGLSSDKLKSTKYYWHN